LAADKRELAQHKLPSSGTCGQDRGTTGREFIQTKHTLQSDFKACWGTIGAEQVMGLALTEELVTKDKVTTQ
jgi:hypothetical protein